MLKLCLIYWYNEKLFSTHVVDLNKTEQNCTFEYDIINWWAYIDLKIISKIQERLTTRNISSITKTMLIISNLF